MIPPVSIAVRGIKPFAPKFISCVFWHNPSVVTYIPRTVILPILFSVWNISSSPYSRSRLSFTKFTVLFFEVNDFTLSVLIASAHKITPYITNQLWFFWYSSNAVSKSLFTLIP